MTAVVTLPWAIGNWGLSPLGILILCLWLLLAAAIVPIARGRVQGAALPALLLGTLLLTRLAALPLVQGAALSGDPEIYEMLARSLLRGDGLTFPDQLTGVTFRALYPPAYPVFIAGWGSLLGFGATSYWAGNVLVDIASALILARIGRRLGSPATGMAAAWLFVIWPAFALASPFAQKEGLVTLEVLVTALALLRLEPGRRVKWADAALLGIAWGSLCLTQPGLALLPAILAVFLLPCLGRRLLQSLMLKALPFVLLLMMPWWIRNYFLFGKFVPLTTTAGLGLWIGNNADATGNWMPLPATYAGLPELEMSRRAAQAAFAWVAGNPIDFIRLTFFKLFRAFGLEQFTLGRFRLMTPAPDPALLATLFPLLQGSLITLLTASGALAKRLYSAAGGDRLLLLLCGCAVQILVFSLPFEFGERHRWFVMPFLFLVVASALTRPNPAAEQAEARPT